MHRSATLAICAIAKNESPYIEEWIAFHLLQGVEEILIFDNDSTDGMKEILTRIVLQAPVITINRPSGWNKEEMQLEAYREGAKYFTERAEWVAFIDVDEFIFSARRYSLPRELAEFGPEVGAIAVGHRIFGSSGHLTYSPGFVTSRFVRCVRPNHPTSRWFKTIARPALIEAFDSAHSVRLKQGAYLMADHGLLYRSGPHPGLADRPGLGAICLHHYMVKSLEEYRWKRERARGKSSEQRYTDEFFRFRDAIGNEIQNEELRGFADPMRAMILQWQGGS